MLIGSQHHLTSQANGHIKALLTPSKTDACQAQQMLVYEAKRLPLLQHIMFEKASVGPQTHDSSQRISRAAPEAALTTHWVACREKRPED